MFDWRRPTNLGAQKEGENAGRLAPCRRTPNCVCSQGDTSDREHHIGPLAFEGSMEELKDIVASMPGASVIRWDEKYLYAEFRTRFLRFVDDFELLRDGDILVQVRSASRLGRRDFGVNRKRVEKLRQLIQARR